MHLPTTFPGSPFPGNLPVVCWSHILRVPVVFLPSLPQGYRVLHGGGQGHRKCLLGACGPGQSWQQARGGKDILRSLRNLHSPLLLPPPPYPQLQRRRALGRGGRSCRVSAPLPARGVEGRAGHGTGQGDLSPPFPAVLPSNQLPSLNGQVTGGRGCHLATPAWPRALRRGGFGFPDRDQVSQREKEERKTKRRKKRS